MPQLPPDGPPEDWRELLRALPAQDTGLPPAAGRRARRRARRKAARRRTAQWTAARRRTPMSPLAAFLVVAVLLGAGLIARNLNASDDHRPESRPATSASAAAPPPVAPSSPPTATPSLTAQTTPEAVAEAWARAYWTRNPVPDKDHTASVRRAAPWATTALTRNLLAHDDPAWGRLVSRGGISTVDTVRIRPAADDLPPDSPAQVWRALRVLVQVQGYTNYTDTLTVDAEVIRTAAGWRVSRVLGL